MSRPDTDEHALHIDPRDVSETLDDLRQDFDEIRERAQAALTVDPLVRTQSGLSQVLTQYERIRDDAAAAIVSLAQGRAPDVLVLLKHKTEARLHLRRLQSVRAGFLVADEWQAPAAERGGSIAATLIGVVGLSNNEYVRGGYLAERAYAKKFVSAYIDHGARLAPQAYLTSSGMAACTTVLCALQNTVRRRNTAGAVLVGMSTYFENKWLLERLFPGQILYVDEFDTDRLLALTHEHVPALVFFDSLGNDERIAIPDLDRLVPALTRLLPASSTIVVDNSCLATGFQPLRHLPRRLRSPELIVIESLNKYYEFGSDRVTGGVIWTTRRITTGIDLARIHLGTILPDASLAALPEPQRDLLDTRLRRTERNATFLASYVHEQLLTGRCRILADVQHPSLPTYPGYTWTKQMPFRGCFVALRLQRPYRNTPYYSLLISRILARARETGVSIDHGTSFGFDTTRFSIAAFYAEKPRQAFLRIAVGTETKAEIANIARVFAECL